jgi:hypothetical protein
VVFHEIRLWHALRNLKSQDVLLKLFLSLHVSLSPDSATHGVETRVENQGDESAVIDEVIHRTQRALSGGRSLLYQNSS